MVRSRISVDEMNNLWEAGLRETYHFRTGYSRPGMHMLINLLYDAEMNDRVLRKVKTNE